jgi:hypothetical protein
MRIFVRLGIAVCGGLLFCGIASGLTTSKLPSCQLVAKGIGISTYGCIDSRPPYPCMGNTAGSPAMTGCVEHHYYVARTFPFGFIQYFGPDHNLVSPNDGSIRAKNLVATFILGGVTALLLTYGVQLAGRKKLPQDLGTHDPRRDERSN